MLKNIVSSCAQSDFSLSMHCNRITHDRPLTCEPAKGLHTASMHYMNLSTDKALFFIRKMLISLLFVDENICCGYSLEAPRQGASNEYPQHMFSSTNKENIMWIPPLICSYV